MSHDQFSSDTPEAGTRASSAKQSPPRLLMVAVDGTEQSTWAAQVAATLVRPLRADVVLVHVMDPNGPGAPELAVAEAEWCAELRRNAGRIFDTARNQFPQDVPTQRLLREGGPAREIIASADEWGADVLVMGAHGRGRLATFLLGSTTEAVIRGARCPVSHRRSRPAARARNANGSGVGLMSVVPSGSDVVGEGY